MIKLKFEVGDRVVSKIGHGFIYEIYITKDGGTKYLVNHNNRNFRSYSENQLNFENENENQVEFKKELKFSPGDEVSTCHGNGKVLHIILASKDDCFPYCVVFDDGTYNWFSEDDLKTLEQGEGKVETNLKFKAGDRVKTEDGDGVIEETHPIETVDSEQKEITDTYNFNVNNLSEIDLDRIFDENGESFVSIPGCKVGVLLIDASFINDAGILTGLRFLVVPMQEKDVDQYLKSLASLRKLGKEKKVVVKSI